MEKYLSANQIAEFLGLQNLAFRNGLPMASWNWDVGAEFRISIKKPGLQGLRP